MKMTTYIWLIVFCSTQIIANDKFPITLLDQYKLIDNLKWTLKPLKDKSPHIIWIAKRRLKNKKKIKSLKNIIFHTRHKSAKKTSEVLIIKLPNNEFHVFLDLDETGLVKPFTKSSFKALKSKDVFKGIGCDNDALSIYTEAGINAYFCSSKGKLSFYYDPEEIP